MRHTVERFQPLHLAVRPAVLALSVGASTVDIAMPRIGSVPPSSHPARPMTPRMSGHQGTCVGYGTWASNRASCRGREATDTSVSVVDCDDPFPGGPVKLGPARRAGGAAERRMSVRRRLLRLERSGGGGGRGRGCSPQPPLGGSPAGRPGVSGIARRLAGSPAHPWCLCRVRSYAGSADRRDDRGSWGLVVSVKGPA